jgi:hypothetical protein
MTWMLGVNLELSTSEMKEVGRDDCQLEAASEVGVAL